MKRRKLRHQPKEPEPESSPSRPGLRRRSTQRRSIVMSDSESAESESFDDDPDSSPKRKPARKTIKRASDRKREVSIYHKELDVWRSESDSEDFDASFVLKHMEGRDTTSPKKKKKTTKQVVHVPQLSWRDFLPGPQITETQSFDVPYLPQVQGKCEILNPLSIYTE